MLSEAIVVLTMVGITFKSVRHGSTTNLGLQLTLLSKRWNNTFHSQLHDTGYFYRHFIYTCILFTRYQTLPCYLALFALAEIFELAMAFDALRLRNIIQLIGILSKHEPSFALSHVTDQCLVFHGGLIVMGALQVHQTRTALVQIPNCDATVNYIVS